MILGTLTAALGGSYAFCVWKAWLPLYPLAAGYVIMSLFTAGAVYYDKAAASENDRRIPEILLHGLELLGGWPGSLFSQLVFRHKIKKAAYQIAFWLIVLINAAAGLFAWRGTALFEQLNLPKPSFVENLPSISKFDFSRLFSGKEDNGTNAGEAYEEVEEEVAPEPSLDEVWAEAPTPPVEEEPYLGKEPGVSRSRIVPNRQCRRLHGMIRSVSPIHGLLITLPPDIGGDGVILPSTLVPDFQRRFKIGEQVVVAVKGIEMHGSRKQVNLFLDDP